MPARARMQQHSLPPTWLMWRRDAFTPNVEALKYLIIEMFDDRLLNNELLHPLQAAE